MDTNTSASTSTPGANSASVQGYCVKCRVKRDMQSAEKVTMKTGRDAMKGKCGTCGTGMYSMLKSAKKAA